MVNTARIPASDLGTGEAEWLPGGQDLRDVALQPRLMLNSGTSFAIATVLGAHGTALRTASPGGSAGRNCRHRSSRTPGPCWAPAAPCTGPTASAAKQAVPPSRSGCSFTPEGDSHEPRIRPEPASRPGLTRSSPIPGSDGAVQRADAPHERDCRTPDRGMPARAPGPHPHLEPGSSAADLARVRDPP
jgi:hypothetical protein